MLYMHIYIFRNSYLYRKHQVGTIVQEESASRILLSFPSTTVRPVLYRCTGLLRCIKSFFRPKAEVKPMSLGPISSVSTRKNVPSRSHAKRSKVAGRDSRRVGETGRSERPLERRARAEVHRTMRCIAVENGVELGAAGIFVPGEAS